MNILYFEFLKLRKKSRGWLGPILVFILIMTAFPLTVEFLNEDLEQAFFFYTVDCCFIGNDACNRRYIFRRLQ